MSAPSWMPAFDDNDEITRLIATFHETERRLEELTGGEVDAITDQNGRTLVLGRAQAQIRVAEAAKQAAILDALPANVALLDGSGAIVSVNETWRQFASANDLDDEAFGVGSNYLRICDSAVGPDAREAVPVAAGIRAVLTGIQRSYSIEYPCHSPSEQRWFVLTVTPLAEGGQSGAVVMHLDITKRKLNEHAIKRANDRLHEAQRVGRMGDWDVDLRSQKISWSPQVFEILGRDPALGPPRNLEEHAACYDQASQVVLLENVARAISSGEPQEYELTALCPNGDCVAVWAVAVPEKDESGVFHIHGTIQDISVHKRAIADLLERDSELRETEAKFAGAFEHAPMAMALVSTDRVWLRVNRALCELFGYSEAALIGKSIDGVTHPDDVALSEAYGRRAIEGDSRPFQMPKRYIHKSGNIINGLLSISLVRDERDQPLYFVTQIQDVTERLIAENALRDSTEKFKLLANNIDDVFWIRSSDMKQMYYVSPGYKRIWGRSAKSLTANPHEWSDFIVPEDRERVRAAFEGLASSIRTSLDIEYRIARPDGEVRWIRARAAQVRDDQGAHIRNIGIITDITEKQRALEALRQSQQRLRDIFDGIGPSMFVGLLSPEGIVIEINRSPLEAAGLNASDVIGQPFVDTPWWNYSSDVQRELRKAIARAAGGESSRYDERIRGVGDQIIDIDFSLEPLRDEAGKVVFLISSASVITDRKYAEVALRQAQKMEAVGQLAAGVAHEFNNLLQALMSMTTIVHFRSTATEVKEIATQMDSLIRRGAELTRQLLLFSRQSPIEKTQLDLGEQVQKAASLLRLLFPETIGIVTDICPDRLMIDGDDGQIQQVLLNLAINARDALHSSGLMTLRTGRIGAEVFQEVEDSGDGMSAETQARLFEPFFTTKESGKGTGLGLAVVHGIVKQHGGRIEVWSEPGVGSRFRVILPLSSRGDAGANVLAAVPPVSAVSGRVVLVEDNADVRGGIAILLEMIGYEITAVESAEAAIALVLDQAPDLVLSDVTLPGMSGPEMVRILRRRWPSVTIVLMSGYLDNIMRTDAAREGWHFLQKPFQLPDLARELLLAKESRLRPAS